MTTRKLRIGVSCRALLQREGGVKRYLSTLIPALLEEGKRHEFVLLYNGPDGPGRFPGAEEVYGRAPHRVLWDHIVVPRLARRAGLDVAFFPKGQMPFGLPCPAVVTIHDLGYFVPGLDAYPICDRLYQRWALKSAVKRAARVIAVSGSTRGEIVKYTGVAPERIDVVHEAVPGWFSEPTPAGVWEGLARRLGIESGQYVFIPSSITPRKNLRRLVEAFARVRDEVSHNVVLTGVASWGHVNLTGLVKKARLEERVVLAGLVSTDELVALYRNAACCAYVSLYEGFGLPILESMASGCPVITSSATSMPEVAGDGAEVVDPTSVDEIAAALVRVLNDAEHREELIRKGTENLVRFDARQMARRTLDLIEQAASGGTR